MTDPTPKQKALETLTKAAAAFDEGTPASIIRAWLGEGFKAVRAIDERVDGRKHKKKGGPLDDPNVGR